MNSATPAFLALLLVCSLPLMTLAAAAPGETGSEPREGQQRALSQTQPAVQEAPTSVENTTNRLELTGETRNEHATYNSGLGMELARTNDELVIDAEQFAIADHEFDDASIDERAAMLEEAHEALRNRTADLEEREQEVVRAHANGDRSNAELLEVLLRNSYEANAILDTVDELEERADTTPGFSVSNQQSRADSAVAGLHRTPIRETLDAAGQTSVSAEEHQVQIRTTDNGYSLAMIDDRSYLVETTRFDHRDTDAPDQFSDISFSEQADLSAEIYPWATENGDPEFRDGSNAQLYWYRFDLNDNLGYIQLNVDGGTGEVYREYQELTLSELPVSEQRTWTDGGLEVTMNETPVDGPTEVTVAESSSGEPEAATISIDGVEVGETDSDDGTLWYVPPTGEYELSIETSSRSISPTITDE